MRMLLGSVPLGGLPQGTLGCFRWLAYREDRLESIRGVRSIWYVLGPSEYLRHLEFELSLTLLTFE